MKKLLAGGKRNEAPAIAAIVFAAILLYVTLMKLSSVRTLIARVARAAAPVLYGFGLAFVLNIPMRFLEERVFSRLSAKKPGLARSCALVVSLLLIPGLAALTLALLLPRAAQSVSALASGAEYYAGRAEGFIRSIPALEGLAEPVSRAVLDALSGLASDLPPRLPELAVNAAGTAYSVIVTLVICVHSLVSKDALLRFSRRALTAILPKKRIGGFLSGCAEANSTFKKYFTAQLLSALLVGAACYLGMRLLALPYPELIALVIFIGALIPIFGPWVSVAASALIILAAEGGAAAFVIMMLAIQFVEDYFVYPRLIGGAIGMKGLEVLASVVIAGGLFGFRGLLVAVPAAAVLRKLVKRAVNERNMRRAEAGETA